MQYSLLHKQTHGMTYKVIQMSRFYIKENKTPAMNAFIKPSHCGLSVITTEPQLPSDNRGSMGLVVIGFCCHFLSYF